MADAVLKEMVREALREILSSARGGSRRARVGLVSRGSELGPEELAKGALLGLSRGVEVVMIGPRTEGFDLPWIESGPSEGEIRAAMEGALASGEVEAVVALHYDFPLGVATVGRVITPARGKEMFISTSTGTSDPNRVKAMVLNAVAGIAVAKACGVAEPTVGVLNVEGARAVSRALSRLKEGGYPISFGASSRSDGGMVLRGNDLIAGSVDVCVCDTLTGNVLMKLFSAFHTGGLYEALGYGYGPSVGPGYPYVVNIISRASGAPVIGAALEYAAVCARAGLPKLFERELEMARRAGLDEVLSSFEEAKPQVEEVKAPPAEPVTAEIAGVDVLEIERAVKSLWRAGIYAESGMGCTGPVIKVSQANFEAAMRVLREGSFV